MVVGITNMEKFSWRIIDGPPFTSGLVHIGTATNKILKDFFVRISSLYFPKSSGVEYGWDMHGLPVELRVHETLFKDLGRCPSRSELISGCDSGSDKWMREMVKDFGRLNLYSSPTSGRFYRTKDRQFMDTVLGTFKVLWNKGLIYQGLKILNNCGHCRTVISDHETIVKPVPDRGYVYCVEVTGLDSSGEEQGPVYGLVYTTVPWTLYFNQLIAVDPNSEYGVYVNAGVRCIAGINSPLTELGLSHFKEGPWTLLRTLLRRTFSGLRYSPFFNLKDTFTGPVSSSVDSSEWYRFVEGDFVSGAEGTGLVHISGPHGEEDYQLVLKEKIPSRFFTTVTPDGFISNLKDGRRLSISDTATLVRLKKPLVSVSINHRVKLCSRCTGRIFYGPSKQWFLKIKPFKDQFKAVFSGLRWNKPWYKKRFEETVMAAPDWCISRQRDWGTIIPVWSCSCGRTEVFGSFKELFERTGTVVKKGHRDEIDPMTIICSCGLRMSRVPDILDVWFDSGAVLLRDNINPDNSEIFITEAHDQFRGWFFSTAVLGYYIFSRPVFGTVFVHGYVKSGTGLKFSKSKGTGALRSFLEPGDSPSCLRLYLLNKPFHRDFVFKPDDVKEELKYLKVLENLVNLEKYYGSYNKTYKQCFEFIIAHQERLSVWDKWFLSRLKGLVLNVNHHIYNLDPEKVVRIIRDFTLKTFSRTYVKIIRPRLRNSEVHKGIYKYSLNLLLSLNSTIVPAVNHYFEGFYGLYDHYSGMVYFPQTVDQGNRVFGEILPELHNLKAKNKIRIRTVIKGSKIICPYSNTFKGLEKEVAEVLNVVTAVFEEGPFKVLLDTRRDVILDRINYEVILKSDGSRFRKALSLTPGLRISIGTISNLGKFIGLGTLNSRLFDVVEVKNMVESGPVLRVTQNDTVYRFWRLTKDQKTIIDRE